MRLLERYALKSFIASFVFCTIMLIVVVVVGDVISILEDIFRRSIPLSDIFAFYLNLAPFAFVNMVPFSALLAGVYVFNSMSKTHELTAVISSGISLWRLVRPILVFTGLLCIVVFIVNDRLVPDTMLRANRIKEERIRSTNGERVIKDVAFWGEGGLILFAREYDVNELRFSDVTLHLHDRDNVLMEKISAAEVQWEEEEWIAKSVISFSRDEDGLFGTDPDVRARKPVGISESPHEIERAQWDVQYMSFESLKEHIDRFRRTSPRAVRRFTVDLHHKLAFPFVALITLLVGIPFSVETGRTSALIGMAKGIFFAMLYLPVMALSLALGKAGVIPPVLSAWLGHIVFGMVGVVYINRKS